MRRRLDDGRRLRGGRRARAASRKWERIVSRRDVHRRDAPFEGRTSARSRESLGKAPFDALLDIVVADGLRTGLRPDFPAETAETWQLRGATSGATPATVIGGSDAGAHLDLFCARRLLDVPARRPAVRDRDLLTIEEAVHQLTDVPARLYGLVDRGRIADGWWADIVLFDPETRRPAVPSARVDDLPGGASRLTAESHGVEHVLVGGVEIATVGKFTGDGAGRVLRSGTDTETVRP